MSFFTRSLSRSTEQPAALPAERRSSAMADPEWRAILDIDKEALKAWRIPAQGKPIAVPDSDLGYFLQDEMYAILKVANHNRKLVYNLFFWMSKERADRAGASPPEKVAQLMALLEEKVVVHREIAGHESPQFKAYFKQFGVLKGNVNSMFNPDHPEAYSKRLLHFKLTGDGRRVEVREVPISKNSLNSGDVFILDEGIKMTQWNGSRCDEAERILARKYITNALKQRKTRCTSEFFDEEDMLPDNELYRKLGKAEVPKPVPKLSKSKFEKVMLRLSDETRTMTLNQVYKGKVYRAGINPDDVTFLETHKVLFVYIGPGASAAEKASVWTQSEKYLKEAKAPEKAIAVFSAGCYCEGFEEVWDDTRS